MLPLYFVSVGISYLLAGDHSSYNPFERLAGLDDGGYPPPTTRFSRARTDHHPDPDVSRTGPIGRIVRRARRLMALIMRGRGTRPDETPATSSHARCSIRPGRESIRGR